MTILIDTNVKIMATGNQDYSTLEKVYFKIGSRKELNMQIYSLFNIWLCTIVNTHSQHAYYNSSEGGFRAFMSYDMNLYWVICMFSMLLLKMFTYLLLL